MATRTTPALEAFARHLAALATAPRKPATSTEVLMVRPTAPLPAAA